MVTERRQQNDAFQAQLPEQSVHLLFNIRALYVPRLHHQVHAGLAAALNRPSLEFAQVIPGTVAKQSNQKGSIAGQATRVEIRPVVELLDGLENSVARIAAHSRLVVDDA